MAHVAANADALGNLVRWAATGEPAPMYASPQARAAAIQRGLAMPGTELATWLRGSAATLASSFEPLTPSQCTQMGNGSASVCPIRVPVLGSGVGRLSLKPAASDNGDRGGR